MKKGKSIQKFNSKLSTKNLSQLKGGATATEYIILLKPLKGLFVRITNSI